MTKVVNFCGGPSAGKTTCGLNLAGLMKAARLNVLYVPEFATELVVDEHLSALDDQLYLFGEQAHRLYRAQGKFDWVVTDSPLFMMLHYVEHGNTKFGQAFAWKALIKDLIMETFEKYDNYTFFVDRKDRKFLQPGRVQNEEQSKDIDESIKVILMQQGIEYRTVSDVFEAWAELEGTGALKV